MKYVEFDWKMKAECKIIDGWKICIEWNIFVDDILDEKFAGMKTIPLDETISWMEKIC